MNFFWNPRKGQTNERKHGVSFHEAATIFGDPLAITFDDPDHSEGESRFLTFGQSRFQRLLVVSHTDTNETIWIISAREVSKHERGIYENG